AFLVMIPTTKLRHMFSSPMNMYLKDRDRPKGAMKPMPNLMETELESFGAVSMFERISTEELWACTSCKACDEICPVNIEILDKILDMRRYLTLMESD